MQRVVGFATAMAVGLAAGASVFADERTPAQFRDAFLTGELQWQDVLDRAKREAEVSLFYWGGNDVLNVWMDSAPGQAMSALGIRLNANRLTRTRDAIDLVLSQAAAGKTLGEGSADLIWLNGENFLALADRDLLFGPFADKLPHSVNFDWDPSDRRSHLNLWDFGTETKAREIPWSSEQYVCAVNRQYVSEQNTPSTFADLKSYLETNPGRFAYVKPPNGLGTTFVAAALYAHNPDGSGAAPFQKTASALGAAEFARLIAPGMDYLKSLAPLLVKDEDGKPRYLADDTAANVLFRAGTTHFTCAFGTYGAATRITTGHYPNTAEAMIFPKDTMIKNKNFLAIPGNASHPAAALVLANYMASVEAQAGKLRFAGYPAGIDQWMLSSDDAETISNAAPPHVGVTQSELDANAVPDINASLIDIVVSVWRAYVEERSTQTIADLVTAAYPANDN